MIQFLRAFAWLRWRLLLNGVRGGRRRDAMEQVSRLLALIVPAAVVAMSAGGVMVVAILGALGGHGLVTGRFIPDVVVLVTRALLVLVTALVVFMPVGAAAQKGGTTYTRLLLLPIPARALHLVEVLAGLADPWLLLILPGLGLFGLSMAVGGRVDAAGLVLVAAVFLVGVLASMGALVGFLVSWLFRDRRRAEMLTVIFMMLIAAVAVLPQVFGTTRRRDGDGEGRPPREAVTLERVDGALPGWTQVLPSEMFGRVVVDATQNRPQAAVGWLAAMLAEGMVCFWLSGLVHRRLLQSAGGSSSRRGTMALRVPWRAPGLSEAAAAVAWAQVKSSLRSVRGRLAVLLPGPMLAVLALVVLRAPDEVPWVAAISSNGHLVFGASLIVSIYSVQPFTMNQFACDRSGLTQQFLLPLSTTELVQGKAVGGGVLLLVSGGVAGLAAVLAVGGGSPLAWLTVGLGGLATYISITPVTAFMSAVFPVAADMSKPGRGGNPHAASMFVGTLLVLIAAAPPLLIVAPGLLPFSGPPGRLAAMVLWLAITVGLAWPLLSVVARVVAARRENLFLTIAKR
ncbi:MAG: hypothetical protein HQ485_13770 [Acidobacteria bacterium]|nr:hypothetical protein [Acidobacteriota bacterium]